MLRVSNNITITGDILYKTEPVTMTGGVGVIDQLIPANDTGQVLGIYTSAGNIQLDNKQTNQNLEIDASLAAISATGSGGLVNTGNFDQDADDRRRPYSEHDPEHRRDNT